MDVDNNHDSNYIATHEFSRSGYRKLRKQTETGDVVKLRNGLYATEEALANTVVDVEKIVPRGVVCLYSAWEYHGLTTQVPDAVYVAIDRKRKVTLPQWPAVRLVYQSKEILDIGVQECEWQGYRMRIYDAERSVCDAVKYRNKAGIDVMSEILGAYLARPDRNIERLRLYAERLRIASVLKKYLEVKL